MRPTRPRRTPRTPAASPTPRTARPLTGVLAGAALSVAAVGMCGSAAFAGDFGNIDVTPDPAPPGSTVTLATDACGDKGGQATVDASSLGAGTITLGVAEDNPQALEGALKVPGNTKPGNYGIGGSCKDGNELTGTVVVGQAADKPAAKPGEPGEKPNPEAEAHPEAKPNPEAKDGPPAKPGEKAPHDADGRHHPNAPHDAQGKDHDAMPHGRVDAGSGAGGGLDTAQVAGGTVALVVAAGGAYYLRRRHLAKRP